MELKDLTGEHVLDAVDFEQVYDDYYENSQVCRFRLDGITYVVIEDPKDGYRSSMKEIRIEENANMINTFPPVKVVGRYRTKGKYGSRDDILELIDVETGKTVLEVGTKSIDDYYQGFVASFKPENMSTNSYLTRKEN